MRGSEGNGRAGREGEREMGGLGGKEGETNGGGFTVQSKQMNHRCRTEEGDHLSYWSRLPAQYAAPLPLAAWRLTHTYSIHTHTHVQYTHSRDTSWESTHSFMAVYVCVCV